MPGRVAAGAARAPRRNAAAKSSGRTDSATVDVPDEGAETSLRRAICTVFVDAQKSTTGHRKAIITLRKIQEACCYEATTQKKTHQADDFDEDEFNQEVIRCTLRVLPVKKSEPVGDRVVRFLGAYLTTARTKDNEIFQQEDDDPDAAETPTARLVREILNAMIPLMMAKEKTIRFRATQMTSHIVNTVGVIDLTLFQQLKMALMKRIYDKEAPVRIQAIYGLTRFAAEPDEDEDKGDSDSEDEAGSGILEKLVHVLQNDPSAEVRRNLLLNMPLTKEILPYLFERARDVDVATRKALFARLLPALGDFRSFSMTFRDKLLRWGLRDRDETVRKAMARLFCERWIEDCAARPADQDADEGDEQEGQKKPENQAAVPSMDALTELLERIDIVNSGGDGGIALVAMQEFWKGRPDYVDYVSFPDEFWSDLSPEIAFIARTFNDYCRNPDREDAQAGAQALDALAEEKLPELTKFAFLLQRELNRLMDAARIAALGEADDGEEILVEREFVVEQMLHISLTFDYSDEVGRRKMDILMRDALAMPDLPEEATRLVVENLRRVCGDDANGEREFCRLIVEAIAEVHDTIMGDVDAVDNSSSSVDESFHSATSQFDGDDTIAIAQRKLAKAGQKLVSDPEADAEKAVREMMVNLKCLHIALCLLQNIHCDIHNYVDLVTLLNNLIVPAVRSHEMPIRERGLLCLGLSCLLSKSLATENMDLFLHCFAKGQKAIQVIAIQCITDVIIAHPSLLTELPEIKSEDAEQAEVSQAMKTVLKAFSKAIKSGDPNVQAIGATGLSKAMLSRLITDADLLRQLVVTFFDPDSASNPQFRQSLSYFLPVYCHSRAANAAQMASIACSIINKLTILRDARLEDEDADAGAAADAMVSITHVANMLVDWTDPRKIVGFGDHAEGGAVPDTHFLLAEAVLERLVTAQMTRDERKALLSMLGKLHLPPGACEPTLLKTVLELLVEAAETGVAVDKTSENVLQKLRETLMKLMHDVMTAERGGGDTVLESTEIGDVAVATRAGARGQAGEEEEEEEEDVGEIETADGYDDAEGEEDDPTAQLQREMRDTTVGFTTAIVPDAEGTRLQLVDDDGDTEMTELDG